MTVKNTDHNYSIDPSARPDEELRRKAEDALRETEERYRDLVENATDLICTHDLKGRFLSVNAAAAGKIGLAVEEILGLSLPDLLPEDRRHEFNDYIKTIQRDGKAAGIIKVVIRNGEVRYWEYHNTLRKDGVPEPVVRGIARDVTGEVLAKRALKKSEKRYRLLFERNLAGVYRTTIDGRIIDCNDAFARIYGYDSREEAMMHAVVDFYINPKARQEFIIALQIKGILLNYEVHGRRKDGSLIWLLENASLIPDKDARLTEIEGTLIDITERKKAEEELFQIFSMSLGMICIADINTATFLKVNPAFTDTLGYSEEELLGKSFLEFIHPEDIGPTTEVLREKLSKGEKAINFENRYLCKDGSYKWLNWLSHPVSEQGITYAVAHDVTDRKKMEEEILKADKLESVGVLAGGIAHDFNNFLTSIIGNISLAMMHMKPGSKAFDLLNAAEKTAIKASGLTNRFLTFAKGGVPVKETVSIQNLIRESSLFVLQGSKSGCEFSIAEDLWPVEADAGQISQVISNIVINANQSMPEGGIIRITADNLVLEEGSVMQVKPGRYVHISIRDQGTGIAEKDLSKIFDPYFTTKKEGSGLGLAAAYSIIKMHKGYITVDSLIGTGTTFDIYLPASDKEIPVKEESALIKGRGKILVMDDDRMLSEMAKAMLEILGYEADFAKNGAEAIEIYSKTRGSGKPYDAVILDLSIPGGMGGKETVMKLLELDPELRAIVCSGYSDDPVMSNYREYGFKGMMAKPFELKTLSRVLNEVLKEPDIEDRTSYIES